MRGLGREPPFAFGERGKRPVPEHGDEREDSERDQQFDKREGASLHFDNLIVQPPGTQNA